MSRHIFKHYIRRVSSIGNSFEVLEQDVGRICGIFHIGCNRSSPKAPCHKKALGTRVLFPSGTQPSLTQVDLGHPTMHQPQKRQTSRTPATQIQVSSQKSAEILSVPLRPSWEVSDIPHRPTVCIMLVYSTPSLKERHMARNAHPEVTRQRILDAAKKLFAQKGV